MPEDVKDPTKQPDLPLVDAPTQDDIDREEEESAEDEDEDEDEDDED